MLHNGKYTLENGSGEHRTFSIKTQAQDSKFAPGARVIALLTGPDNEADYIPFGFVDNEGIKIWKKYRDSKLYPHYALLLSRASRHFKEDEQETISAEFEMFDRKYRVLCSKVCRVCNRTLTTPESIRAGIGPVCDGRE